MQGVENDRQQFMYKLHLKCEKMYMQKTFHLFDSIVDGDVNSITEKSSKLFEDEKQLFQCLEENYTSIDDFKLVLHNINLSCLNAARLGNLPQQIAYIIYTGYDIMIDKISTIDKLLEYVLKPIMLTYVEAVAKFSTTTYSDTIVTIVDYILTHINGELALQAVGDRFSIHPVHLARKFKHETGQTFVKYITTHRIFLAKFLIFTEEHSLADISHLTGFNSQSYFSKVFKKETKKTPMQYSHDIHHKLLF